ncbi:MAG: SusF/SusE family outer membrane protein, partial [Bacteroidota bacterium]
MKNKFFRTMFGLSWLVIFALITFTSCEKDDDNGDDEEPILVEDGLYIVGPATPFSDLDPNGALLTTKNEVVQEERAELKDIYISLKGGENFHIESVAGAERQTWGPGADFAVVPEAERDIDEPKVDFWRGSIEEGTATFTVPNDGLYHIAMDTELNVVVVAPVQWGVIGAATPNGWGSSTPLELQEFNQDAMTFEKSEVIMVVGDYKFRYSDGWKINLDTEYDLGGGNTGIKVNTNYGGTLDNLVPGGDNMSLEENGVYTVSVTWSLEEGISATVTKTGDYTPPS